MRLYRVYIQLCISAFRTTCHTCGGLPPKWRHISQGNADRHAVAKAAGAEDCGCNRRRKTLNEILPYTKKSKLKQPHINTKPLEEIIGEYEVLQEIHCTLPANRKITFNIGSILLIDENHPLYKDIPFYYKNNIIKKL